MLIVSDKYREIAEKLINSLDEFKEIRYEDVRIVYLVSDEEKKKNRKIVYGECTKVDKKYAWCCPYDFMITIYEQNCIHFSEEQYEHLIQHELHHVGIDQEGNETTFYVVPHDVEEFWELINQYGIDWDR